MRDADEDEDEEELAEPEELLCATCGSINIHRRARALYFFVIAALAVSIGVAIEQTEALFFVVAAAAIFSVISDRWLCTDCGNSWK